MRYGLPYQGSKNAIVPWIIKQLPQSEVLVDLFAGGCAITHGALISGRWKRIICNDVTSYPQLFLDAVNGKYHNEKRWISREDFFKLKDTDPYVALCWSFGNAGTSYLYGVDVEAKKRAKHYAVVFDDWNDFTRIYGLPKIENLPPPDSPENIRLRYHAMCKVLKKHAGDLESLERLESLGRLQSLQSLESLQSLGRLESLGRLQSLQMDYRSVDIPPNAVIYCDPPYANTNAYAKASNFDHNAFYDWCERQTVPLFISEYSMPEDRFTCVAEIIKPALFSSQTNGHTTERLFRPKTQVAEAKATFIQGVLNL